MPCFTFSKNVGLVEVIVFFSLCSWLLHRQPKLEAHQHRVLGIQETQSVVGRRDGEPYGSLSFSAGLNPHPIRGISGLLQSPPSGPVERLSEDPLLPGDAAGGGDHGPSAAPSEVDW